MKISKESSGINLVDSENSIIIWIFRVVSLFSYQGSALSLCYVSKIYYIKSFLLCQHFFYFLISCLYRVSKIHYIKSLWPCQHFFLFSFCFFIASTNIILSNSFGFVKTFFNIFKFQTIARRINLLLWFYAAWQTEKEGFEPSRRY